MAVLNSMVIVNSSQPASHPYPSRGPLPTFACRPIDFLDVLLHNLKEANITVNGVRLYGGAASYVIREVAAFYNDIDLMIHVDFNVSALHLYLDRIKEVVLKSLREIVSDILLKIPNRAPLDDLSLTSAYVAKMYKHAGDSTRGVTPDAEPNIWSLFSFNNFQGRNIEVKFVHTLERQYKFSIDSWQIDLSKDFLMVAQTYTEHQHLRGDWPRTTCYCLFPDLGQALSDVETKTIRVLEPESVRGGCFLRYVGLLHKQFSPPGNYLETELKMISRFLNDFTGANNQARAIESYIHNHMGAVGPAFKCHYLQELERTVSRLCSDVEEDLAVRAETLENVVRTKIISYSRCAANLKYQYGLQRLPQDRPWIR